MKEYLKGLQHIGIPTADFSETLRFYEGLGFETILLTKNGEDDVAFLQLGNLVIETYTGETVGRTGAIDHIAIDVTDVEAVHREITGGGYKMVEAEIQFLPFFENGVRYFIIEGPNGEKLEFNQKM